MKLKDHRFEYIWGLIDCHSNGNSIEFRPFLSLALSLALCCEPNVSFQRKSGFLFKLNCYRMPFLWHKCFRCALFVFFYQLNFSPFIWKFTFVWNLFILYAVLSIFFHSLPHKYAILWLYIFCDWYFFCLSFSIKLHKKVECWWEKKINSRTNIKRKVNRNRQQ